jgi:hypothetical protein
MSENWSINPDTRNPDRLREFLKVLAEFEGKRFDRATQIAFFRRIVQKKLYVPNAVKNDPLYKAYYESEQELPDGVMDDVMRNVDNQDLRGRGKAAPLSHFGFCIARERLGPVVITDLGRQFLRDDVDLKQLFFRVFLKWQFPNPISRDFTEARGYNIVPFVATLHFLDKVNRKCMERGEKAKGISRSEFALFLLTMKDANELKNRVSELFALRDEIRSTPVLQRESFFEQFVRKRMAEIYGVSPHKPQELDKKWRNLLDYTDTVIRYFRLTDYIYIRGNGQFVDLSPTKSVEIDRLLSVFSGVSLKFADENAYVAYLGDLAQPEFPWENAEDLAIISRKLREELESVAAEARQYGALPKDALAKLSEADDRSPADVAALKRQIDELRGQKRRLLEQLQKVRAQEIGQLQQYIEGLNKVEAGELPNRSLHLEWYVSLSLQSLNDAILIKPNFPVGDDNTPLFTAPSGKPDIECFYSEFQMICEVTMLRDRSQWVAEGQPVQRHVREFEEQHPGKTTYCLFIAPAIHQDTLNTFFIASKYEYQGRPQKIVPLTIRQYIGILTAVLELRKNGRNIRHTQMMELLDSFFEDLPRLSSVEWIRSFPLKIDRWIGKLVS